MVVVAAGNSNLPVDLFTPANCAGAVTVAAVARVSVHITVIMGVGSISRHRVAMRSWGELVWRTGAFYVVQWYYDY
jgi:hypothetical protein